MKRNFLILLLIKNIYKKNNNKQSINRLLYRTISIDCRSITKQSIKDIKKNVLYFLMV